VTVRPLFPAGAAMSVGPLLDELAADPTDGPLVVGDDRVRDFLVAFGKRLLAPAVARRFPELGSLGFFLRRAEIDGALAGLTEPADAVRSPRGTVFHVPPANVDTIFVYSWALAALAGNRNVVRISSRSAGAAEVIVKALNDTLPAAHPAIAQTQRMVTYGRDDAVTSALSRACDLRVIWGGDASVNDLRRHPLPPSARDLTFPDRSSFAVLSADGWGAAAPAERLAVAEGLYNDVYWFDQAACSSPRALLWVGPEQSVARARDELVEALVEVVARRRPAVDASMAVQGRVSTYGLAAEGKASRIRFHGNEVTSVELADPEAVAREWLGVGMIAHARVDTLADLVPLVQRRDQTLSHFGFSRQELTEFVRLVGGRGVDRLVPIGRALAFSSVWDGYELLREFTRLTTIAIR